MVRRTFKCIALLLSSSKKFMFMIARVGADRRQRVNEGLYLSIGIVRVEFDIQRHGQPRTATCCTGTATLFAGGSFNILTCAHNLVHYDPTTKTCLEPSRELRVNTAERQLK